MPARGAEGATPGQLAHFDNGAIRKGVMGDAFATYALLSDGGGVQRLDAVM
ncbi:hypothetical protein D3C84_1313430 [compost metagenome]